MQHDTGWRVKVALAFLIVYIVWGSTYLAIRIGVAELPPALFAGARFVLAGVIMAIYARLNGHRFPTQWREWKIILIVGGLLLVGGNGLVVWAEQWVPSNQTALIIAVVALWIAWFGTMGSQGQSLSNRVKLGLAIGFGGVAMLVMPGGEFSVQYLWAQLALIVATVFWAAGSVYGKRQKPATHPLMASAMQMLFSGVVFLLIGLALDEPARWHLTESGMLSILYLAVFGSCFAYSAYQWLVHEVSPSALGTYAYINPAVAVVLGWWWLDESLTPFKFAAMFVILSGVALVTWRARRVPTAQVAKEVL